MIAIIVCFAKILTFFLYITAPITQYRPIILRYCLRLHTREILCFRLACQTSQRAPSVKTAPTPIIAQPQEAQPKFS